MCETVGQPDADAAGSFHEAAVLSRRCRIPNTLLHGADQGILRRVVAVDKLHRVGLIPGRFKQQETEHVRRRRRPRAA